MSAVLDRPAAAESAAKHMLIAIDKLIPSPLNHRKHFDEKKMAELTDNVRAQGIVVPLIVRPILSRHPDELGPKGGYEIVAGERRFRAAQGAKLAQVPAIVRSDLLTDAQVLEVQVIENQQRADVLPLEEAEGYAALMKCTHPDGTRYTVDEIAAKVGMSKSHVYQRLKLISLCKAAREALAAGEIEASVAVLIARIPNDGLQKKALEEVSATHWRGAMTYKQAQALIQDKFMLRLANAPFDVKAIYFKGATAEALAPVCAKCPKRTGNQAELFADVGDGDVCTDPSCFEGKRLAHVRKTVEEAEKAGRTVLRGDVAKDVVPNSYTTRGGYLRLDDRCYDDEKQRTYRQILGKKAVAEHVVIAERDKGDVVELVKAADVKPILKEKGIKAPEPTFNTAVDRAARQREADKRRREELIDHRVRLAIYKKHPGVLGKAELIKMVGDEMESASLADEDWQALGLGDDIDLDKLSAKDLTRLLVLCHLNRYDGAELTSQLAKSLRIDTEKIKREVAAEAKAAKAEPKNPKKK